MRALRRLVVTVAGLIVIVVGIILIPLPGPGSLVIVGGLAILGSEFETPKRWVASLRSRLQRDRAAR